MTAGARRTFSRQAACETLTSHRHSRADGNYDEGLVPIVLSPPRKSVIDKCRIGGDGFPCHGPIRLAYPLVVRS